MHKLNKSQILKKLKLLSPTIVDPTMTMDMGLECLIATNTGIVYPKPGMFLDCGGMWPIKTIINNDPNTTKKDQYSLELDYQEVLFFNDKSELEKAFLDLFALDDYWEDIEEDELILLYEEIYSKGISILEVA